MNVQVHRPAVHDLTDHARPTKTSRNHKSIEFTILASVSAICLILGVADANGGAFSGLALALGAIFFGLAFITKALQKAEEAAEAEEAEAAESEAEAVS